MNKTHCHTNKSRAHHTKNTDGKYYCPMCTGVEQDKPGDCPICGMTLEASVPRKSKSKTQYTCPMHPEIIRDDPGDCPLCGMALEPMLAETEVEDPEFKYMMRRFKVSATLAIPVFLIAMGSEFWPEIVDTFIKPEFRRWLEFILATPVVLWGGWSFFKRGGATVLLPSCYRGYFRKVSRMKWVWSRFISRLQQ